jgi:predicted amidohydrolase YtcJ
MSRPAPGAGTLILSGGAIHTMDPRLGSVAALGIADGRIKAAGEPDRVLEEMARRNGSTWVVGLSCRG